MPVPKSKSAVRSSAEFQNSLSLRFNLGQVKKPKSTGRKKKQGVERETRQVHSKSDDSLSNTIRCETVEWVEKEAIALGRSQSQSCAICHDFFRNHNEQILHCSHVFHSNCLSSFERFVGYENRFCPLCRLEQYSKSLTSVGSLAREKNAAIILEACARGFLSRCRHRIRLRSYYKDASNATNDETLTKIRQQFYIKELEGLGNKLLNEIDCNEESMDDLACQIDQSLAISRDCARMLDERQKTAANNIHWDVIMKAAFDRKSIVGEQASADCPICMSSMERRKRRVTLLSCSHIFCSSCINAFEAYNVHRSDGNACPVCRSKYAKLQVVL